MSKALDWRDIEPPKTAIQEKIVEATVAEVSARGFAGSSTRSIAQRAGVSEGSLFKQYRSKRGLLLAAVAPIITRVVAPLATRTLFQLLERDHESLEAFVTALHDDRLQMFRGTPARLRILLQEVAFQPDLRQPMVQLFREQVLPRMIGAIERLQERGLIAVDIAPGHALRLLISTIGGYGLVRFIAAPDAAWVDDEEQRATITMLCRALSPQLSR